MVGAFRLEPPTFITLGLSFAFIFCLFAEDPDSLPTATLARPKEAIACANPKYSNRAAVLKLDLVRWPLAGNFMASRQNLYERAVHINKK